MFGFGGKKKPFVGFTHKVGGFEEPETVSSLLNWSLVDDKAEVVMCKDTSLLAVFEFRGPDMDSSTRMDLKSFNAHLNGIVKSLPTGFVLYFDANRHFARAYDRSKIDVPLVQMMDDERAEYYSGQEHFETSYYFVVYQEPPQVLKHKIVDAFIQDKKNELKDKANGSTLKVYWEYLDKFLSTAERLGNLLDARVSDLHRLNGTELVTYLHDCVSPSRHLVNINPDRELSEYLYEAPGLTAGNDMKLGDKYLKIVTILNTFPPFSYPGLFDAFNNLDVEYRWVSRYVCMSKADAQKELDDYRVRYSQMAKSLIAYVREAITHETSETDIDENSLINRDDSAEALQELNSDLIGYGYYTMTITVMDDDKERCTAKANHFVELLQSMGFTGYVETFNSLEAWWGSLPGHYRANIRRPIVNSLNFCHFSPATAVWPGDIRNDFLNGPVLLYTDTNGYTPFRLSLHVNSVGHTMVVGPSGSGKSVLLNTLEAHFLKYKDSKVFIFDKAASSRALTLAVGGNFYNLAAEGNGVLSFQPLAHIDDENEIKWANKWILAYLRDKNMEVGPVEENFVWNGLLSLREVPVNLRTITNYCTMVQSPEIRVALQPLTNDGSYGRMFDNSSDFTGAGRWQVYEMETLMATPDVVPPTLDYLFHRTETALKDNTGPAIIVLDECWLFMDNPAFRDKLREYLKDMRKKNTSIIIATQNLADIAAKPDLLATVLAECQSKIYLPNINASSSEISKLYHVFNCNDRQIELITQMTPKQDYYYASSKGNRIFRLALRPIEVPFVTATAKSDQLAMNKILAEHDKKDFIQEWLHYKDADDEWEKYYSNYIHIKEGE